MSNEDTKIQQLYQSLQFCIKSLDQILMTKKQVPNLEYKTAQDSVVAKVENQEISPQIQQLTEQLETLKHQHDEMLLRLKNLRKQLHELKGKYQEKDGELEAYKEFIMQNRFIKYNANYKQIPREEINLYKSVKTYVNLNQSNFTLFLKSLLNEIKQDSFLNLDQLLNSIQDYYKNQQMYLKPKFSLNTVERLRLPSLEVRYFTNRRYKDQSLSIDQESRSQSFA